MDVLWLLYIHCHDITLLCICDTIIISLNALQFLQEGARIQAQLTLSLTTLAKTKEKYEKVRVSNIRGCTLHISNTNTEKDHVRLIVHALLVQCLCIPRHLGQVRGHWSATTRQMQTSTCQGPMWRSRG